MTLKSTKIHLGVKQKIQRNGGDFGNCPSMDMNIKTRFYK